MPTYEFDCPCGNVEEEHRSIASRDDDLKFCSKCERLMTRRTVYLFTTTADTPTRWPYNSSALVPSDPALYEKYRSQGRLVDDGQGGVDLRIDSKKEYEQVLREQGVRQMDDYEKVNRSVTRPYVKARDEARKERKKKAKEEVREHLEKKGVL